MVSEELAQVLGTLSVHRFELFNGAPRLCKFAPREPFSQRQSHEFLRPAQLVDRSHWKLDRAAEYLRTLVCDSAHGIAIAWKVPAIRSIFEDAVTRDCL